ncbi:MAG TPA: ABC transporter ATP-binding protein [Dehalococcoidia bacterium]|nr:ABC transporter ATP-binding protein [Dehalococcoidia bacterium]
MTPLLKVTDLRTYYRTFGGRRVVKAVDGVSFTLEAGATLGLVGESGCGKTTTCHSIVRLLPKGSEIVSGSIEFDGVDLTKLSQDEMQKIRGKEIGMILQDPMASLNPLFSIYDQVSEPAYYHRGIKGRPLQERVTSLLQSVRIPSPKVRMKEFPHMMSGGMRQRIVGAIALSGGPRLIIADEPTTNLDVTIQAQYLDLLRDLQQNTGVALIFVTHDLGIIAKMCDEVIVMYAGKAVEQGPVREIFTNPKHPYTEALLASIPKMGSKDPLVAIEGAPPDLASLPPGCPFAPRCKYKDQHGKYDIDPPDFVVGEDHKVKCWLHEGVVAHGR